MDGRDALSLIVERTRIELGGDSMRGVDGNGLNDVLLRAGVLVPPRGSLLQGLSQSKKAVATSGEQLMAPDSKPDVCGLKLVVSPRTGVNSGLFLLQGSCSRLLRDRDDRSATVLRKSFQS